MIQETDNKKKIAILHDYFRVLGGAEKLVIDLAEHLGADIITSEIKDELLEIAKEKSINIISLGKVSDFPSLLPPTTSKRFSKCDFSDKYDIFIFSGSFSIYASEKHKPNIWYCHTPLKGLYYKKDHE